MKRNENGCGSSRETPTPERCRPQYDDDDTLDVPQVAEILGVCKNTVFGLIRTGELKSFTIRRRRKIRGHAVRTFLDKAETA